MSPEPTGVHGLLKQRKLFTHKHILINGKNMQTSSQGADNKKGESNSGKQRRFALETKKGV